MNIWHVCDLKYFDKLDPRNPSGDRCHPWPPWLVEKYAKYRAGPANPELFFTSGSSDEQAFLADTNDNQIPFSMKRFGKWDAKNIDKFRFYHGTDPRGDSPIFMEVSEVFENQLACDWPLSVENLQRPNGCGDGKKQIRKLIEPKNGKFPKYAIFNLCLFVRAMQFQTRFVVSRDFRDTLIKNKISGIEFVPILKRGIAWTETEMQYSFLNDRILENCEYFQLIITGRTAPVRLKTHSKELEICSVCRSAKSESSEELVSREVLPADFLNPIDFQGEHYLVTSDGVVERFWYSWKYYISARVVRLIMTESSLALRSYPGKYGKFLPVLIEGEF